MTDVFPVEILLEIFDIYRQSFGDQLRDWNSKNGWFKLAHVCHSWRSVILASPSRLQVRLYFAHNTPTRAVALECLSHLPIIVDYSKANWKASAPKRFVSALRYSDRVCKIAVRRSVKSPDNLKISKALDSPFPALESLEIDNSGTSQPILLPTSLTSSIRSLRQLRLAGACFTSLVSLSSATGALVDLTLKINTVYPRNEASLLTYIQHMTHLRNLHVDAQAYSYPHISGGEIPPITATVVLAELTSIHFFSDCAQTERFVARLATPSLRELHILAVDRNRTNHEFDIPCLSEFIRVVGISFFAARLAVSLCPMIVLFAHPHSSDDPPSQVLTLNTTLTAHLGRAVSEMLATLEDIFLSIPPTFRFFGSFFGDLVPWRKFFEHFCNVKVLRLHHGLETEVALLLWKPSVSPPPPQEEVDPDAMTPSSASINGNRSRYIFPLLEEIVVYDGRPDAPIEEEERASALESFGFFATARHQMGRPVKVSWSTDGEPPMFSLLTDPTCLANPMQPMPFLT
jgi:hypothetical protein